MLPWRHPGVAFSVVGAQPVRSGASDGRRYGGDGVQGPLKARPHHPPPGTSTPRSPRPEWRPRCDVALSVDEVCRDTVSAEGVSHTLAQGAEPRAGDTQGP